MFVGLCHDSVESTETMLPNTKIGTANGPEIQTSQAFQKHKKLPQNDKSN